MKTILIIEDDESISRGVAFTFEKEGYQVLRAGTIGTGKNLFAQNKVDLVILDVGLPDGNGLLLCESIRAKSTVQLLCSLQIIWRSMRFQDF